MKAQWAFWTKHTCICRFFSNQELLTSEKWLFSSTETCSFALLVGCLSWSSGFWFIPKTVCITHCLVFFFLFVLFYFFKNGFKTRCSVKQHTRRVLKISYTLSMSWRNMKLYQYVETSCPWWRVSCVHAVVCDVVMVTVHKYKPVRSPSLLAPQLFLSLYSIVKKLYIYIYI